MFFSACSIMIALQVKFFHKNRNAVGEGRQVHYCGTDCPSGENNFIARTIAGEFLGEDKTDREYSEDDKGKTNDIENNFFKNVYPFFVFHINHLLYVWRLQPIFEKNACCYFYTKKEIGQSLRFQCYNHHLRNREQSEGRARFAGSD